MGYFKYSAAIQEFGRFLREPIRELTIFRNLLSASHGFYLSHTCTHLRETFCTFCAVTSSLPGDEGADRCLNKQHCSKYIRKSIYHFRAEVNKRLVICFRVNIFYILRAFFIISIPKTAWKHTFSSIFVERKYT